MKVIQFCIHIVETFLFVMGICCVLLRFSGIHTYVVLSGSMEPNIKTGAIVLVDMTAEKYKVDDIVTYNIGNQPVTHRIVKMDENSCITKGDANQQEDPVPVKKSQILGKVLISIPFAGYLLSSMKSKQGILVMLFALFLANLFDILSEVIGKNNEK